jgi:putative ABC transport system ATP-binding protein
MRLVRCAEPSAVEPVDRDNERMSLMELRECAKLEHDAEGHPAPVFTSPSGNRYVTRSGDGDGLRDGRALVVKDAREPPLATAVGLSRRYGSGPASRAVLDSVDLEFEAGQFVAIAGASGSGKSTLLHLLGGLDRPSAGSVIVAGVSLGELSQSRLARFRRDTIGFVFQAFQLIPELTAWENVLLPVRLAHDLREGRERASALFRQLDLGRLTRRLPVDLSGGEQQRVAIARALVMEPRLVLADEPTGNLDAAAGAEVIALLRAAVSSSRAVVMVTHDERHATAADRIVRLSDGRII